MEVLNRWVEMAELEVEVASAPADAAPTLETPVVGRAAHHRERSLKVKPEAKSRRVVGEAKTRTVKSISAASMISKHFPDDLLIPDATKKHAVFCRACRKSRNLRRRIH